MSPLYGLVLAGGRSSRMQTDKAALAYDRQPQLARAFGLLTPRVQRAWISVRADQREEPLRAGYPQIVDGAQGTGPIAGIIAAQALHPDAAWLVLACDLPLLDGATLDRLLARRDAGRLATAFRSASDGLPEPLCAIYEPASREPMLRHVTAGHDCPRKFLIRHDALLLEPPNPRALDNANTPLDVQALRAVLASSDAWPMTRLSLRYYALFRERAGRQAETLETAARTPAELYRELAARHGFALPQQQVKVAVNAAFADWNCALVDGDEIVFIPPVAGG